MRGIRAVFLALVVAGAAIASLGPTGSFVSVAPCRILDTRPSQVLACSTCIPGTFLGPLTNGTKRAYLLTGRCGIPASGVAAVSVNLTATNTTSGGNLALGPALSIPPTTSTLNWTTPGVDIANALVVPLDDSGRVDLVDSGGSANVILDVNGYFQSNPSEGSCALCYTCGGQWPVVAGAFGWSPSSGLLIEHGPECAGPINVRVDDTSPRICCRG